jgi:hypothetical protein
MRSGWPFRHPIHKLSIQDRPLYVKIMCSNILIVHPLPYPIRNAPFIPMAQAQGLSGAEVGKYKQTEKLVHLNT